MLRDVASIEPGRAEASTRAAGGRGSVVVSRGPRASVVTRAYAESPLKWLTPRSRGDAAWVFASSYGGGLVGGDRLAIDVRVEAGAGALLSTQASTKAYRSPRGVESHLTASVDDGGLLVSLPDPVTCFAGSSFRQTQAFHVHPAAGLVALDWMTSGRRGSGERWAFVEYASATTVRIGGRVAVHDAVRLTAADGDLADRLGRFDVLALIVIAGERLAADAARAVAAVAERPVTRRAPVVVSAAPMPGIAPAPPGCVVRLAGERVEDLRAAVRALLDFVPARLGDDPWARKW
jgi:urease accessory protein